MCVGSMIVTQSKTVSGSYGAYVFYADAVKRTSENGWPVSAQVLSDSPERPEEEGVADEEEAHLYIEEEGWGVGGSCISIGSHPAGSASCLLPSTNDLLHESWASVGRQRLSWGHLM